MSEQHDLLLTQTDLNSFYDSSGYLDTDGEIGILKAQRDKVLEAVVAWMEGQGSYDEWDTGSWVGIAESFKKDFGLVEQAGRVSNPPL